MSNFLRYLLLKLIISIYSASAINFDVNKVVNIKVDENDRVDGSYFGYSLLLQKGSNPIVIVGAPKQSNQTGGRIFSCDILSNKGCIKYNSALGNNGTFNGNFFGSVIDGDDETGGPVIACAPRKVTRVTDGKKINYYLKGLCLFHRNSSSTQTKGTELFPLNKERAVDSVNDEYYYDHAFGQAGIDISFEKGKSSLIMGATGIKNWSGAVVIQSLKLFTDYSIVPQRLHPVLSETYDYLGYKVGYGRMGNMDMLYAGAPRAQHLFGKVKLYHNKVEKRSFIGEEMGAYFGSAILAQDVNNDGSDDLFIGAPTAAGASFDEGCVYFYKNALGTSVKLFGKGKQGSRFGTNIAALGDIDLDKFNDVAIAAPFEDDGVGAVYIFMGGSQGIRTTYSQRLVPSAFPGISYPIKGFGMGLSKGNDVDGNGHNDIAIGAFKSGHVFFIPTKSVIDFRTVLEPNVTSISSTDNQITIKFCVSYKPRSALSTIKSTNFQLKLDMDYRVKGPKLHIENVTVLPGVPLCRKQDIKIEEQQTDIIPFSFSLETRVLDDIQAEGTSLLDKTVPFSHGCGSDNICQTKILIDVISNTKAVIVGLTKTVTVNVYAENVGEPGYQCRLLLVVPEDVELTDKKRCTNENSTYNCPFASKLFNSTEKEVTFDVSSIQLNIETINITFKITCLGDNYDDEENLVIYVRTLNSPYIQGTSDPENFENDFTALDDTMVEFRHTFIVGNFGPSPVKTDVYLLVPQKQTGNVDLIEFVEAKRILRGVELPCYPTKGTKNDQREYDLKSVVKSSPNSTILFDCYEEGFTCMELFCEGDYLYKTTETAKYILKVKTSTKVLADFFKSQPENKHIIAFVSSAFLYNGTRIETTATTLLLSSNVTYVPLWVYVVASVIGILLLGLIIFICYKCHFFDRRYREKLNSERLLDSHVEMDGRSISEDGAEGENCQITFNSI